MVECHVQLEMLSWTKPPEIPEVLSHILYAQGEPHRSIEVPDRQCSGGERADCVY